MTLLFLFVLYAVGLSAALARERAVAALVRNPSELRVDHLYLHAAPGVA